MAADDALIFRLELLPAEHGDCILITYGPQDDLRTVLIDGGPPSTFPRLSARLQCLPASRRAVQVFGDHSH